MLRIVLIVLFIVSCSQEEDLRSSLKKSKENEKSFELVSNSNERVEFSGCRRQLFRVFATVPEGCKYLPTGLIIGNAVLKNASIPEAEKLCKQYNEQAIGGYKDWRMPMRYDFRLPAQDNASAPLDFYKGRLFQPRILGRLNKPGTLDYFEKYNYLHSPYLNRTGNSGFRLNTGHTANYDGGVGLVEPTKIMSAICVRKVSPQQEHELYVKAVSIVEFSPIDTRYVTAKLAGHLASTKQHPIYEVPIYTPSGKIIEWKKTESSKFGSYNPSDPLNRPFERIREHIQGKIDLTNVKISDENGQTTKFDLRTLNGRKFVVTGYFDWATNRFKSITELRLIYEKIHGGCNVETDLFSTTKFGCKYKDGLTWFTGKNTFRQEHPGQDILNATSLKNSDQLDFLYISGPNAGKPDLTYLKLGSINKRANLDSDNVARHNIEFPPGTISSSNPNKLEALMTTKRQKQKEVPVKYCQMLNRVKANGLQTWRLPTIKELENIRAEYKNPDAALMNGREGYVRPYAWSKFIKQSNGQIETSVVQLGAKVDFLPDTQTTIPISDNGCDVAKRFNPEKTLCDLRGLATGASSNVFILCVTDEK